MNCGTICHVCVHYTESQKGYVIVSAFHSTSKPNYKIICLPHSLALLIKQNVNHNDSITRGNNLSYSSKTVNKILQ